MEERRKTFFLKNSFLEVNNARKRRNEKMLYSMKCKTLSPNVNPKKVEGTEGMAETAKIKSA